MRQVLTAQVEIAVIVNQEEQVNLNEFREFLKQSVIVDHIGYPIESVDIKVEDLGLTTEMHLYSVPIEWRCTGVVKVWARSALEASEKAYDEILPEGECVEDSVLVDEKEVRKLN